MGRTRKARRALARAASNEAVLALLFAKADLFTFPDLCPLRRVCRAWRSAIDSIGVLSSHAKGRERIARLYYRAPTPKYLQDLLVADHIAQKVACAEERRFCTADLGQAARMSRMLDWLHWFTLALASACCSRLGPITVVEAPEALMLSARGPVSPSAEAAAAFVIASAAMELQPPGPAAEQASAPAPATSFQIVIASVPECGGESIECLGGSYLVVPPDITFEKARRALERAIRVFARVHEIEREKRLKGAKLVAAVTGVILVSEPEWVYSPLEQHLWVGMLLFREDVAMLAGERVQGSGSKHGVDPKKKCVLVPWNFFEGKYSDIK
eukprot:m51a1_g10665 hypothetical protein (328) ;mRNA; r:6824-7807